MFIRSMVNRRTKVTEDDIVEKTSPARRHKASPPRAKVAELAAGVADISLKDDCLMGTTPAAALVGLTPKTLRQLRCDKAGPRCYKLGAGKQARVVYRRSDLEAWVKSSIAAIHGG